MNFESNQLVNIHELARTLRLPVAWLQQEADAGRLPVLKVGHRRLFNFSAVKHALAERAAREGASDE